MKISFIHHQQQQQQQVLYLQHSRLGDARTYFYIFQESIDWLIGFKFILIDEYLFLYSDYSFLFVCSIISTKQKLRCSFHAPTVFHVHCFVRVVFRFFFFMFFLFLYHFFFVLCMSALFYEMKWWYDKTKKMIMLEHHNDDMNRKEKLDIFPIETSKNAICLSIRHDMKSKSLCGWLFDFSKD